MIIKKPFEYRTLERTTNNDGTRFYLDPITNEPLTSVTTILSATADKGYLVEWQKRVGIKKAEEIRNEAAALGTLIHTHLECHIQDIPRPRGSNLIRQMAERMSNVIIDKGFPHIDEVWGFEVPLWYPGLFAGTTDLVGHYNGKPTIFDYKNTKRMKTIDQIVDYRNQIAAYSLCHNEIYGTNIEQGVIFMIARDLTFETFIIEGEDFKQSQTEFLIRLEKYLTFSLPNI